MTPFDAFHLPGFDAGQGTVQWAELRPGATGASVSGSTARVRTQGGIAYPPARARPRTASRRVAS